MEIFAKPEVLGVNNWGQATGWTTTAGRVGKIAF